MRGGEVSPSEVSSFSKTRPGIFPLTIYGSPDKFSDYHLSERPMKRAKSDRLTGGTNDVNPQWYKANTELLSGTGAVAPQASAVKARVGRFLLPVNRINQNSPNTATVIELLKVRWSWAAGYTFPSGNNLPVSLAIAGYLSTAPISDDISQPQLRGTTIDWFADDDFEQPFLLNPTSNAYAAYNQTPKRLPIDHDLTDGDGHGVLIATDAIQLLISARITNQATGGSGNVVLDTATLLCEMLYRYKTVSLTEYIGIVQSQERAN